MVTKINGQNYDIQMEDVTCILASIQVYLSVIRRTNCGSVCGKLLAQLSSVKRALIPLYDVQEWTLTLIVFTLISVLLI